ncbi:MAG: hypothetical protein K2X03_27450 [Bryobacteraceae bacterium]|nr:hypothetical protein [Bryobacteraceae bacterium]
MTTPPPLHQPPPTEGPKKTPVWVWIIAAVGGVILLAIIAIGLLGYYAVQKVKEVASNPSAAAALIAKLDPNLEVLDVDDQKKIIRVRNKRNNEEVTLNLTDIMQGKLKVSHEGKNGVEDFQIGGEVKLPSWMPAYPGAAPKGLGSGSSDKDGAGGLAMFETPDAPEKVLSFYRAALDKKGFTPGESVQASGASVLVMKSDDGKMATITATVADGSTKVTLLYGGK